MGQKPIHRTITTTLVAAADLAKHRFVVVDSNGKAAYAGAAGKVYGVTDDTVLSGEACPVIRGGDCLVEASAAIAIGAIVISAANGKAVTGVNVVGDVATGAAHPAGFVGYAMTAASADGDLFTVQIKG